MPDLPQNYAWLATESDPKMLREALALYGVTEVAGPNFDNPTILAWADEVGGWVADFYGKDSIPWCGLFIGIVAKRAGKPVRQDMLGARKWLNWGSAWRGHPRLGDVLVFWRGHPNGSAGHVGLYVGEDDTHFHVLGGNQDDAVNIRRFPKSRLIGVRHHYAYGAPANVRRVFLAPEGVISESEA